MAGPSALQNVSSLLSARNVDVSSPNGRCSFVNLTGGVRCGCQRFSDQAIQAERESGMSLASGSSFRKNFCMCEHHACYHEYEPTSAASLAPAMSLPASFTGEVQGVTTIPAVGTTTHIGIEGQPSQARRGGDSNLPDTATWQEFMRTGSSNASAIPPIPQECMLPSQSVSSRHSIKPTRFQALQRITPNPGHSGLPATEDPAPGPESFIQSVTDAISPSVRESPDLGSLPELQNPISNVCSITDQGPVIKPDMDAQYSPRSEQAISLADLRPRINMIMQRASAIQTMRTTLQNLEYRLDHLETGSFSNPYMDDVNDKLDLHDTRFIEHESRMEEIERSHAALIDGSRRSTPLTYQTSEPAQSFALATTEHSQWNARLESLETQVSNLHSAHPSHARPWEVEVIFLPFGAGLKGIWSVPDYSSQRSRTVTGAEHWQDFVCSADLAQLLVTHGDETTVPYKNGRVLEMHEARACARGSVIEQRLRSRGLVKTVQVRGPDARDVFAAIKCAFSDLPDIIADGCGDGEVFLADNITAEGPLALRAPWIPLRKIHKESTLRFLEPSEMTTQALWTVPFLASSVVMKSAGKKRLYVTHRNAYLQPYCHSSSDWTWQKLKDLKPVQRDSDSCSDESEVSESCWDYDERFDPKPEDQIETDHQASFTSLHSALSIRQTSQQEGKQKAQWSETHSTPLSPRTSPDLQSREPPAAALVRPPQLRTTSMPSLALSPVKATPAATQSLSKRRIASFAEVPPNLSLAPKRARVSRSPSMPGITPRWSNGPPSPYTREATAIAGGYAREHGEKSTTPFAYATPHSNTAYLHDMGRYDPRDMSPDIDDDVNDQGSDTDVAEAEQDGDNADVEADEEEETFRPMATSAALQRFIVDTHSSPPRRSRAAEESPFDFGTSTSYDERHDEEWFGVEDESGQEHNALSDLDDNAGDTDAIEDGDDAKSEVSEAPSEYPIPFSYGGFVIRDDGNGNGPLEDRDSDEGSFPESASEDPWPYSL